MGKMTVEKAKKLLASIGLPTDINIEITDKKSQGYYPNGDSERAWRTPDHSVDFLKLPSVLRKRKDSKVP